MLERILSKTVFMILERLAKWAVEEIQEYLERLKQDKQDKEAREKLAKAQDKAKKLQQAKNLVDSATRL